STTSYVLTETITGTGCKNSDTVKITVNPKPLPAILGNLTVCSGSALKYGIKATSGNNYNWTVKGGTITNGAGTDTILVKWGAAGAASIKVVESNNSSCSDSSEINITINPLPEIDAGKDTIICVG